MTTPPFGRYEAREPRVPRTIGAISDALRAGRRAQFFAELLDARRGPELDGVLSVWWGRAMRDTDPGRGDLPAAVVEAAALPGRIIRVLPVRSTRSKGPWGANGSPREEGPPETGGQGKTRITVTVDPWLGAYAEELVETGRAPSVSAVVNEALAERFLRERRARRVRAAEAPEAAETVAVLADTAVRDRADPVARDRADVATRDRVDLVTRDRADPVTRDRIGRLVVHVELPPNRPGGSPAGAE